MKITLRESPWRIIRGQEEDTFFFDQADIWPKHRCHPEARHYAASYEDTNKSHRLVALEFCMPTPDDVSMFRYTITFGLLIFCQLATQEEVTKYLAKNEIFCLPGIVTNIEVTNVGDFNGRVRFNLVVEEK